MILELCVFGTLTAAAVGWRRSAWWWRSRTSVSLEDSDSFFQFICLLEFRGRKSAWKNIRTMLSSLQVFVWTFLKAGFISSLAPPCRGVAWLKGSASTDSCKLAAKRGETLWWLVVLILLSKRGLRSLPVGAAASVDQADSHLLELIHYSWDLHTCHNLLVFPPAMRVCCEAPHFSLWSVSHSAAEVRFSSYAYKCTFYLTFILFCILFALFCFPLFLPKPLMCPLTPPTRSPNRGQCSVAHPCRCL